MYDCNPNEPHPPPIVPPSNKPTGSPPTSSSKPTNLLWKILMFVGIAILVLALILASTILGFVWKRKQRENITSPVAIAQDREKNEKSKKELFKHIKDID
jgi:hypothetical protein